MQIGELFEMNKKEIVEYVYPPIKQSDKKPLPIGRFGLDGVKFPSPEFLVTYNLHRTAKFGKAEVEWAAQLLIEFFAHKKQWCAFDLNELSEFCKSKGEKTAASALFGLICCWSDDALIIGGIRRPQNYIIQFSDGQFMVTTSFLKRFMPEGITKEMLSKVEVEKRSPVI